MQITQLILHMLEEIVEKKVLRKKKCPRKSEMGNIYDNSSWRCGDVNTLSYSGYVRITMNFEENLKQSTGEGDGDDLKSNDDSDGDKTLKLFRKYVSCCLGLIQNADPSSIIDLTIVSIARLDA